MANKFDIFLSELASHKRRIRYLNPGLTAEELHNYAVRCTTAYQNAFRMLKSLQSFEFPEGIKVPEEMPCGYCFRVRFNVEGRENYEFNGISISLCPSNYEENAVETALILDNNLVYIEDVGYEDINRFYGDNNDDLVSQVVGEIKRVFEILTEN